MSNVTVTSTTSYIITVDDDSNETGKFAFKHGSASTSVLSLEYNSSYMRAPIEVPASSVTFLRNGSLTFKYTGNTNAIASWQRYDSEKLALTLGGELDLRQGALRLPILTTLPGSPTEGQLIIYQATVDEAPRGRLAMYLNSGWRYSDAL